jgi:hypothetical protein
MKVKHIFIDIDGTLTVYPFKREFTTSPMTLLENMVMERHGLSRQEAFSRIKSCGDTSVQCLSEFLEELQISRLCKNYSDGHGLGKLGAVELRYASGHSRLSV